MAILTPSSSSLSELSSPANKKNKKLLADTSGTH
jgi:hypothetical protein